MNKKIKCSCGKMAVWLYMPSESDWCCCDSCVPRGCSCNEEVVNIKDYEKKHLTGDEPMVSLVDERGRLLPCCEWWHFKEGFDVKEEKGE